MIINIIAFLFAPLFMGWLTVRVYQSWDDLGERRGFLAIGMVLLWIAYFWMMVGIISGRPFF